MVRCLFYLFLFLSKFAFAQQSAPFGHWTSYLSHKNGIDITSRGSSFYMITSGGLTEFNYETKEFKTFTQVDGLSSVNPTSIHYDSENDLVFIGYSNGIIDYFRTTDQFHSIRDIYLNQLFNDKSINSISSYGNYIYFCTSFGIVVYDIKKNETRYSYTKVGSNSSGQKINGLTIFEDTVWVGTPAGLFYAPINHPNLADESAWNRLNSIPNGACNFTTRTDSFHFFSIADTVFVMNKELMIRKLHDYNPQYQFSSIKNLKGKGKILNLTQTNNLYVVRHDTLAGVRYSPDASAATWIFDGYVLASADKSAGMVVLDDNLTYITPTMPTNNFATRIAVGPNELYIAPLGYSSIYAPLYGYSGVYYCHLPSRTWKILTANNGLDIQASRDIARGTYHDGSAWMGSWGDGISIIRNGTLESYINGTNSNLKGIFGNSEIRVSGIRFDSNNLLWVSTMLMSGFLQHRDGSGTWHSFTFPQTTATQPLDFVIDEFNSKWIVMREGGLVVFNENGTPSVKSDDQVRIVSEGLGQGNLTNKTVYSIAKDKSGYIWVGTAAGAAVFYNPGSIFSNDASADASCPIYEGRCLLKDEKVKAICVDGSNKKYFGTENGVFVFNAEGTEVIAEYKTTNSPLPSNVINDIQIEPETGEVFFATEAGVVSLMGPATEGKEEFKELTVFPNPVKPEFDGKITIRGISMNGKIRITTISGQLVKELQAEGGQAIWDGADINGKKVASGMYIALGVSEDGKKGGLAKITFLNK